MVQYIPPPNPQGLLPPLLACLPPAYFSPRPPPALLPLLSPILRQRVSLLSWNPASNSNTHRDSWLPLLCWNNEFASELPALIQEINFEPHPVSGEIELKDSYDVRYRRLDEETLHARMELDDFKLLPIFLWCQNDEGGGGSGWRLAELRPLREIDDGTEWFETMTEATDASKRSMPSFPVEEDGQPNGRTQGRDEGADEDDYWAAYDRTPGRTPAQRSPAPNALLHAATQQRKRSTSELEYFARYAQEVQPAMDPHDPDEEHMHSGPGESTLNGNVLSPESGELQAQPADGVDIATSRDESSATSQHPTVDGWIQQPTVRSHSSSLSSSVAHLEAQAAVPDASLLAAHPEAAFAIDTPFAPSTSELQSPQSSSRQIDASLAATTVSPSSSVEPLSSVASQPAADGPTTASIANGAGTARSMPTSMVRQGSIHISLAEMAIKQHVSTDIKSLYRLAKTVGIQREEFEALVRTELEFLGMMDRDE